MFKVVVVRTIRAPMEEIFAMLSQHAEYGRFPGIRKAKLLKPGKTDHNGVGAVRRVYLGPLAIDEEITEYQVPQRLGYRIVRSSGVPLAHEYGRISLRPKGDQTVVEWESVMGLRIPVLGRLAAPFMRKQFEAGFGKVLKFVDQALTQH